MPRTTQPLITQLAGYSDEPNVDASQAARTASVVVESFLLGKGLSEALLTEIELYLAAHFLTLSIERGPLAAESIGESTERYHNIYAAGLRSTRFGQQAISLDFSGTLAGIANQAEVVAGAARPAEFKVI